MDATLYPVVMRALSEPPFECAGEGLRYHGEARTPVDHLRSWLFPSRKNTKPLSKPKSWWQAQLALYGLEIPKQSLTIAVLRAKLEAALKQGLCDHLPLHLQQLEDRLNVQFLAANAADRKAMRKSEVLHAGGTQDEVMAIEDPFSFLQKKFVGNDGGEVCVLKKLESRERAGVHEAAGRLDLVCISADAPDGGRWMVVSKEKVVVMDEIVRIHEERRVVREEERAAKKQKLEDKHAQLLAMSTSYTGKMKIEGQWNIMCDYIEQQWSDCGDLTLSIARKRHGRLVGKFDFGVIAGVIKFKKETADPAMAMEGKRLEFRWRGMEVDTSMILHMDKAQRGWISLQNGGRLEGQFKWQERFKLSGLKSSEKLVEIDETWDSYGAAAYEYARVHRWH